MVDMISVHTVIADIERKLRFSYFFFLLDQAFDHIFIPKILRKFIPFALFGKEFIFIDFDHIYFIIININTFIINYSKSILLSDKEAVLQSAI
jgi:hypothetical protein